MMADHRLILNVAEVSYILGFSDLERDARISLGNENKLIRANNIKYLAIQLDSKLTRSGSFIIRTYQKKRTEKFELSSYVLSKAIFSQIVHLGRIYMYIYIHFALYHNSR